MTNTNHRYIKKTRKKMVRDAKAKWG